MPSITDASQDKIQIHLIIEPQNSENRALAQTVAHSLFTDLAHTPGYTIHPHYTREMPGPAEFFVQIAPDLAFLGVAFVQPFTTKLAEQAAQKTAELLAQMLKKLKRSNYSDLASHVEVQSLPGIHSIDTQGSLEQALTQTITELKDKAPHADETLLTRISSTPPTMITITIRISHDE